VCTSCAEHRGRGRAEELPFYLLAKYVENTVHKYIKLVYSYYSQSPKRMRGVQALAVEIGTPFQQLHYLFEVRFVGSDRRSESSEPC
jgi:hypothetical protein